MLSSLLTECTRWWKRPPCFERTVDRLLSRAKLTPVRSWPNCRWLRRSCGASACQWVELSPRGASLRIRGVTRRGYGKGRSPAALLEALLVRNGELDGAAWQLLEYGPYVLCTVTAQIPLACRLRVFRAAITRVLDELQWLEEFASSGRLEGV